MKRIALLGAKGQLGSDIHRVLKENSQFEVIPVTRNMLDVENTETIIPILEKLGRIDVLINCTAFHNTEQCEADPLKALRINSIAVLRMATYCKQNGTLFIHFSTDYVFDGSKQAPYTEEDRVSPLNAYGSSKAAGEEAIAAYLDNYFIFRVSSLFGEAGASGKGGNFVETMIRLSKQGNPISVVQDVIMSPTYTQDIAETVKFFLEQEITAYGVYHCSGEGACSWYELAVQTFAFCGITCETIPIMNSAYAAKVRRPLYSVLDNNKLNRIYPMRSWQSALEQYLQRKGYVVIHGGEME
ncbi:MULTISPECIES: dTDP-4-dehydrorhamnose reductase [Paenibacillus]|uniref:dTDP-4-dehydrorhamnose reductase n=1 Tax=Paenibacillus violae TaxID=3077234 RepID=A0ABU3RH07_9BACL|nr:MULTISPECIES: dTDP-4-dehydrorhamnose reductase [Paenibacillus]MDU0203569.1 dTDP-4-dehydrorhamnose reductase [Paenibacillus sp. PFR10]MEC0267336.1 dTDP-4-dehydrorhamnose reductase [Paenibacillus anseongense]